MTQKMTTSSEINYDSLISDKIPEVSKQIFEIKSHFHLSETGYPYPFSISKWLVLSSCFFIVPGIYAYYLNFFLYGTMSCITSLASINHWRKADIGIRRNMDLIVAHLSFVLYLVSGLIYLRGWILYGLGIPGCIFILLFFYLSKKMMENGKNEWLYCHFLFHLFVALTQFVVLFGMKSNELQ